MKISVIEVKEEIAEVREETKRSRAEDKQEVLHSIRAEISSEYHISMKQTIEEDWLDKVKGRIKEQLDEERQKWEERFTAIVETQKSTFQFVQESI